ncbi:MAG: pyrroline-5-carboxylate reductase [Tessaracoccus sp.]
MKLAIIGVGAMGEALVAGWIAGGHEPSEILAVDAHPARLDEMHERYGIQPASAEEAAEADVVFIAVKPYHVAGVLTELAGMRPGSVVASIAAGVSVAALEAGAAEGVAVVRVMPNTPALVGEGMAGVAPGSTATDEHVATVVELLEAVGRVAVIEEHQLDVLTALSGSGPAYLFYVAEAMIEAGVHLGLPRPLATELVNQTILGSGSMLVESGRSATQLREMVTSPAGTTAAALRTLDERGVRAAFLAAVEACHDRSVEMAD